jgi:hypothetical protein
LALAHFLKNTKRERTDMHQGTTGKPAGDRNIAKPENQGEGRLTSGRIALRQTVRALALDHAQRPDKAALVPLVEARLVAATWTLRRLPDRERGFQRMRGSLWPETLADGSTYAAEGLTSFQARLKARPTAAEIDAMQPTLDLLLLLPDVEDRRIVFFACHHQDGETGGRIPWARVRRTSGLGLSRWTFKRRYEAALRWLASLIFLAV